MSRLKKKICLVGAYAVGKTSLIRQYVEGIFSDHYLTTIGVKIDQKVIDTGDGREIQVMIWDLEGRDEFHGVRREYLRGAAGYLAVADGTRRETLAQAVEEIEAIRSEHPAMPCLLMINKADLESCWEVGPDEIASLQGRFPVLKTSARQAMGVEEAFLSLARMILVGTELRPA